LFQQPVEELPAAEEDETKPAVPIEPEEINLSEEEKPKNRKKKSDYEDLFGNLPTEQIIVDTLTDEQKTCAVCGTAMVPIGQEVLRTELKYTPPKLTRVEYIGTTWACPKCKDNEGDNEFVKDKGAPPALIKGSYVSSGLAAHVLYAKYALGLPLYRLEKDFENLGVSISRTTMASWVIECSKRYLVPMYDYFKRELLKRTYLMADETVLQVLNEPDRRPQSKSYIWLVRTGEDGGVPILHYHYAPTRARYNIASFLKEKTDKFYLMVDGYKGYNNLPNAVRCCCYAHLRRYFFRAIPAGHADDLTEPAVQGMMYCDKLFRFEKIYKTKGLSAKQIQKRREKDQRPVIEAFLRWADQQNPKNGDRLIRALTYLQNCRPYMMNYLEDGNCSISNNLSEISIKNVVIGRKAWLFSNTQDGANASVQVFTIVETAKANGLDPQKYIKYLLDQRLDDQATDECLAEHAPWNSKVQEICK
ncbi:MAG: IS66 family transposase, partial [Lachnospiraceae bacterium]|nr:IS66 family transposase [Lachnospiraceae bacterium]